ncbi:type I-C CRISPR-associated protein Cas8c/Csd1 [Azospirillum sp. SYSU D00513]|uniref:type I-C CRISPR-associated protein Cas8c/Csd1 n=1 Tax=Azospirillum sp. SYSU D00513 TaxID=2812561 RepID=UPI001A96FADB|nr:type I-C CRISPR-associated protein Cas8c/Csd1 [Azospirillum sp. SYSU D00513]
MTVLAALNRHYDRLLAEKKAPPFGFSTEGIGFCIVLHPDGTPSRPPVDLRDPDNKKRPPASLPVPASFKRPGVTPRAFFLWDNSKFVLGLGRDKESGGIQPFPAHLAAFREKHEVALADTEDSGLGALLGFLSGWNPERFPETGWSEDMLDQNIVFALEEDFAKRRFLHDRPAAQALWRRELAAASGERQMCLVTGESAPAVRLHPAIKGVWGAQTSGASLVSFNLDAFTSYGKEQGANAPVSEAASFGYGTALNILLAKGSANRVQVGDASVVFWADASQIEAAREAERQAAAMLNPRSGEEAEEDEEEDDEAPTDAQETRKLRDRVEDLGAGRPVESPVPAVDRHTRFYLLGLAPNAARLSVRFWHETTMGRFAEALRQHWHDLHLEPPAWKGEPKMQALLYPAALRGKAENIPPLLGGELMRAVLEPNRPYPRALMAAVIGRIRAGDENDKPYVMAARAAVCKAWLVRDARLKKTPAAQEKKETLYVSLDREETNPAYRLGRLFAMLESIQYRALKSVNASIRDRYFGAASATPASVFPLLLRGSNHHLSVLRKRTETRDLAGWFEGQIGEIVDALPPALPRHFGLEDQGRFVVGYYHQRSDRSKTKAEAGIAEPDTATDTNTDTGATGQED